MCNSMPIYIDIRKQILFFALLATLPTVLLAASASCPHPQILCSASICYDPTTHFCSNRTICSLGQQLCLVRYNSTYGWKYYTADYQCYDPTSKACFLNRLCDHPSRSCNQQCLKSDEVCVNAVTICQVKTSYQHYQPDQIQLCNGVCYDSANQQCVNDRVVCIQNCSQTCYSPSTQFCFNGTICSLDQQLCFVKYSNTNGWEYSSPKYHCYNATSQACFNNTLCDHPSRSCNKQCLKNNEVCVNDSTICKLNRDYNNYQDANFQLCNDVCYDSTIQRCVNNSIVCMHYCYDKCYNSATHFCSNGKLCKLSEQLCYVKYATSDGSESSSPRYECYDPTLKGCFNNTVCHHPLRSCNQQCLNDNEVCVNNVTTCKVPMRYWFYKDTQLQLCNGICYDSLIQQCVNHTVECIKNCSGACYNPWLQVCLNDTVCNFDEHLCAVKYVGWDASKYGTLKYECYDPTSEACYNNTICDHPSRSCNRQCLQWDEVCVDNTTICKLKGSYRDYKNDQIQLCNGICYDSEIQQCVHGRVQCIKNCSKVCYNPLSKICLNEGVCNLGEELCYEKYTSSYGWPSSFPKYQCYDPTTHACFRKTLCDHPSRACNEQCLKINEVCVNDTTICKLDREYHEYEDGRIQLCDGVCYDSAIERCVNQKLICMNNCSNICYNPLSQLCLNGTICKLDQQICYVKYGRFTGQKNDLPFFKCYDPISEACFNNTICDHPSRTCNQQCLNNYEVCANGSTICQIETSYYDYRDNRMQLCNGICYDSTIQQCVNDNVECIKNCSNVCYNPSSNICLNGTLCKASEQLCHIKYDNYDGEKYKSAFYRCYDPTSKACFNHTLCDHPSRSCNQQCLKNNEVCAIDATICRVQMSYDDYKDAKMQLCNGLCYDSAIRRCINGRVECIKNCSDTCYNPSAQRCLNGSVCGLDQKLCFIKYFTSDGSRYTLPQYKCYNPRSQACFTNTLCDHPSRSCNHQCLKNNEVCVNDAIICKVKNSYNNYKDDQIQLCNDVCYDSDIQECVNKNVKCMYNCSDVCYNPLSETCLNGTVCKTSEQLCHVKYRSSRWMSHFPAKYECYDPTSKACYNNRLCDHPYRSCNKQCLKDEEVCVNDTTICLVSRMHPNYKRDQFQLCNGVCYDSAIQQCVNDHVECIKNCSNRCYNPQLQICFNEVVCSFNEQLCPVEYDGSNKSKYGSLEYKCYNPSFQACFNNKLCFHPSESCNRQCLKNNEVCVNGETICKYKRFHLHSKADQIQLCNGVCYDSAIEQCVNDSVKCIKNCSNVCYNPLSQKCLNGIVCSLGQQLCLVKYDNSNGSTYSSPKYECYNPLSQACLNNTLCDDLSRSCKQQCLKNNEVCVNNSTICKVKTRYWHYKDNQFQLCNGVCYDSVIQRCVKDRVECIKNCSDVCYNPSSHSCFNGRVCNLGEQLCHVKYDSSNGSKYTVPKYECYDPTLKACLKNTVCDHPWRSCNKQCLKDDEVCVKDKTICKRDKVYYKYEDDQIQLCNGICYDSAIQQCVNNRVKCIDNCSDVCYNPSLEFCFHGTVCNLDQQLCHAKYDSSNGSKYISSKHVCYDPTVKSCLNNTLCEHPSRLCNHQCLKNDEVCVNNSIICKVKSYYYDYKDDQIQLCNGICYDTATTMCGKGYKLSKIVEGSQKTMKVSRID